MISHYMTCQRCGNSTPVSYVEGDSADSDSENCESCGSDDLEVEDAD